MHQSTDNFIFHSVFHFLKYYFFLFSIIISQLVFEFRVCICRCMCRGCKHRHIHFCMHFGCSSRQYKCAQGTCSHIIDKFVLKVFIEYQDGLFYQVLGIHGKSDMVYHVPVAQKTFVELLGDYLRTNILVLGKSM